MKNILLFFSIFYIGISSTYAQGLHFASKEELKSVDTWVNDDLGFSGELPSSASLEQYCPPVLSQGGDGTCVGYSVCYSAVSILYNSQMGVTNPFEKYALAFDPYFMYSALRMNMDVECQEGLNMSTAMNFLYEKGIKRWAMPPYLDCRYEWGSDEWKMVQTYALPFSITNYMKVESISDTKYLLSNGLPVVIGISMGTSIYSAGEGNGTVTSTGLWIPKKDEKSLGGHAVTVIGYDDNKFGGAFRIMNSWGSDYGDNGFIWVKYSDFTDIVKEAWVMVPKLVDTDGDEETINTNVYGRFVFDSGNVYEGTFFNDNFNGVGYFQWKDGDLYFGLWKDGKRNGPGIFFDYSEREYNNVYYEDDVYVERDDKGFGGDGEKSQFDTYLEKFKLNMKKGEPSHDFEMPEIDNTSIK